MLIQQLEEDIRGLWDLLRRSDPLPPAHVRIVATAILRKWLIDGHLSRLAHEARVTLTLPGLDTTGIVAAIEAGADVCFFMAGGIAMDGVPVRGYYVSDAEFKGSHLLPIQQMEWKDLPPSKFLKSKRVYHRGNWFDGEQILRFVANKCGGVHFDPTREHSWHRTLEEASTFFTAGNPDGLDTAQIVETREPKHHVHLVLPKEIGHTWSCLDIELLAMAQSLVHIKCDADPLVEFGPSQPSASPP